MRLRGPAHLVALVSCLCRCHLQSATVPPFASQASGSGTPRALPPTAATCSRARRRPHCPCASWHPLPLQCLTAAWWSATASSTRSCCPRWSRAPPGRCRWVCPAGPRRRPRAACRSRPPPPSNRAFRRLVESGIDLSQWFVPKVRPCRWVQQEGGVPGAEALWPRGAGLRGAQGGASRRVYECWPAPVPLPNAAR